MAIPGTPSFKTAVGWRWVKVHHWHYASCFLVLTALLGSIKSSSIILLSCGQLHLSLFPYSITLMKITPQRLSPSYSPFNLLLLYWLLFHHTCGFMWHILCVAHCRLWPHLHLSLWHRCHFGASSVLSWGHSAPIPAWSLASLFCFGPGSYF